MSSEIILIVDDNVQIANFLANDLLPALGYQSLVAHSGKKALEIVRAHQIDLMLLDYQLSDTTGLEVLRQLASEDYSIPTILITAEGSEQIAVEAFRLGVQDYLIKPIDAESLGSAIERALTETRLRREKSSLTAQLSQHVTRLTVLANVSQSVTSSLELDQVLRRIVEAGVYLTQAEEGFLALMDEQNGQLYLRAVKNIDQDEIETLRLRVNDSLVSRVVSTGSSIRVGQPDQGQSLKVATGLLVHSLLYVPILSKGKVLGALAVDNRISRRFFTEMDETLLTSLADHAAVAIENARLYERIEQRTAELAATNKALQAEIAERVRVEEQIQDSLKEKEVMLQEIHHRVKNNLQILSSLLALPSSYVKDQQALTILHNSQHRVRSMALVHQKLYQSENLARIDFAQYIRDLATYLFRAHNANAQGITLAIQADELFLDIETAVPCGLILNELVTNSLRHAFPDNRAKVDTPSLGTQKSDGQVNEIRIELSANGGHRSTLMVSDNGVGFPEGLNLQNPPTLGLQLVNNLVNQLDGLIELDSSHGTKFLITLVVPNENGSSAPPE